MKEKIIKVIGIFFVVLVILDMVLFALGKLNNYIFWGVIIMCAIMAYSDLPKVK